MNAICGMREVLSFKEPTGVTGDHGDPTYGSLQTARCRTEASSTLVKNARQEEVQATWFVEVAPTAEIDQFAIVWLPGDDTTNLELARNPVKVTPAKDRYGRLSHWEIYF